MELDLWYRWRELNRRASPPPVEEVHRGVNHRPPVALRRTIGRSLIRLGRAIASEMQAPAAG
jgi:hypothetical protein